MMFITNQISSSLGLRCKHVLLYKENRKKMIENAISGWEFRQQNA